MELRSKELNVKDATLLITRQTNEEETIFATTDLNIQEGGGVTLDIAQWDGGGIDLYADANGDGYSDVFVGAPGRDRAREPRVGGRRIRPQPDRAAVDERHIGPGFLRRERGTDKE